MFRKDSADLKNIRTYEKPKESSRSGFNISRDYGTDTEVNRGSSSTPKPPSSHTNYHAFSGRPNKFSSNKENEDEIREKGPEKSEVTTTLKKTPSLKVENASENVEKESQSSGGNINDSSLDKKSKILGIHEISSKYKAADLAERNNDNKHDSSSMSSEEKRHEKRITSHVTILSSKCA